MVSTFTDKTVKSWPNSLENMYVVFKVSPFHKNIARANLKRPKYYFYDVVRVADMASRVENIVACALLKECHFRQDCKGEDWQLYYVGKKGGGEIDFLLLAKDNEPRSLIEVKQGSEVPSKHFPMVAEAFPSVKKIQFVHNLKREKTFPDGTQTRDLAHWPLSRAFS